MLKNIIVMSKSTVICVAVILSLSSLVWADSLTVEITTGSVVVNEGQTDARLLMSFDLPQELIGAKLVFSELQLPILSIIPDSTVLMAYCHPLVITWDPGEISWSDLGDSLTPDIIGEDGTLYATSDEGTQGALFDITEIIRSWAENTIANNGLIFFCDPDKIPRVSFNFEDDAPLARIRFIYNP